MNLMPYRGFDTIESAVESAERLKLSRDVLVYVGFQNQFYAVACEGIDKNICVGADITCRKSWKSGSFIFAPVSDFKSSYKITKRDPRRYTDTIFREMELKDPGIALFTVNAEGKARKISAQSNVNYAVILGLTFKRMVMPLSEAEVFGRAYFKSSEYMSKVTDHFRRTEYTYINPLLGVMYNPQNPNSLVFYGFTHRSQFGPRFETRHATEYEVSLLGGPDMMIPAEPIPQSVLDVASLPTAQIYQFIRRPHFRR